MIRISSQHSLGWPAHGFEVKQGDNEFTSISEPIRHLLQPFIEGGIMVLVEGDETPEATQPVAPTAAVTPDAASSSVAPEATQPERRLGSKK